MIDNWVKLNAKYSHRFSNRLITRTRKIKLCLVIRKRRFATIFECKWLWSISLSKSEEQTGVGGRVSSVFAYGGMNFERWSMNFIRAYDEFVAKINLQLSIEL